MAKRVLIVGAGPGGLAASMLLANAGVDVTILERLPHVGGRTSTIASQGFRFDVGPTFFLYLLSLAVLHPEPKAWVGVKQARLPQQSESFWFSMYCLITDSGAPPQVTMKYARCHKTGFRYTRARCLANSFLSNLDETVLRLLTSLLRATVGGALINRCM